jgi:hypothetical protein
MFAKHFSRRVSVKVTTENEDIGKTTPEPENLNPTGTETNAVSSTDNTTPVTSNVPPGTGEVTPTDPGTTATDGTTGAAEITTPTDTAVPLELPEEDFTEGEQAIDDLEAEASDLDTAADAVSGLDAVADKLETQVENGGASPETMEIVEIAVEHFVTTLRGKRTGERYTPSLESFGGPKRRIDSTQITIEGIREWAAAGAKAIVDMGKRILEFLKGLWTNVTTSTKGFREKLEKLKASIAKSSVGQGTVKVSKAVWAKLSLGGKFTKEIFFAGLDRAGAFLERVLNYLGISRKVVGDAAIKGPNEQLLLEGNSVSLDQIHNLMPIDPGPMSQALNQFKGEREDLGDGVVTVTELDPLPGDVQAAVTGPGIEVVDGVAYKAVTSVDVKLTGVATEDDAEDVEIKGFTQNEATQAAAKIEKLIKLQETAAGDMKQAIDVETKVINSSKTKFQKFKEGAESVGNAVKSFFGRAMSCLASPFGPLIRFIRGLIDGALKVFQILLLGIAFAAFTSPSGSNKAKEAANP